MPGEKLHDFNLKLLAVYVEMMRTGSVSEAANVLNTTQSTVSMALARLRQRFDDELFVRTSEGMQPTPLALELKAPLTQAYTTMVQTLTSRTVFDPATSTRLFRIAMADAGYLAVLPPLIRHQQKVAKNMRVEFTAIAEKTGALMEMGEINLTIATAPAFQGAGLYQQLLLEQSFVAAVRPDHPRIQSALSAEDYQREQHLVIVPPSTSHKILLDSALDEAGITRKTGWQVQSYLGILPILANSDYIATIPEAPAAYFAKMGMCRVFPLPFPVPLIVVRQYWHERFHRDAGLTWLRGQLQDLFVNWRSHAPQLQASASGRQVTMGPQGQTPPEGGD